jgi:hypothetical protein
MARNATAQTAFAPMVQTAIEQYEPPARPLVDDDLALAMVPTGQRAMVRAMRLAFTYVHRKGGLIAVTSRFG